jgi:hypothetical protein
MEAGMKRRSLLCRLAAAGLGAAAMGLAPGARAQRPANPIARPPGQRPNRPLAPGRFASSDGVASGPLPGVFVVVAVDKQDETLQLRDGTGRTGIVHVNADMFDLESLQAGDEVEVDFIVREAGNTRLEAGGLWKVQR